MDILFDPQDPDIVYLADFNSGVYRSENGGNSWKAINKGLRMKSVATLAISADGEHLYAGTDGDGVYRLDLNGSPPEKIPASIMK